MSFEKIVLNVADKSGIENAYFCEGTLFFAADDCFPSTPDALTAFETNLKAAMIRGVPQYSNVGDEVAVDFTLP